MTDLMDVLPLPRKVSVQRYKPFNIYQSKNQENCRGLPDLPIKSTCTTRSNRSRLGQSTHSGRDLLRETDLFLLVILRHGVW